MGVGGADRVFPGNLCSAPVLLSSLVMPQVAQDPGSVSTLTSFRPAPEEVSGGLNPTGGLGSSNLQITGYRRFFSFLTDKTIALKPFLPKAIEIFLLLPLSFMINGEDPPATSRLPVSSVTLRA